MLPSIPYPARKCNGKPKSAEKVPRDLRPGGLFPRYSSQAISAAAIAANPAAQPQRGMRLHRGGRAVWAAAQLRAIRHAQDLLGCDALLGEGVVFDDEDSLFKQLRVGGIHHDDPAGNTFYQGEPLLS